MKWFAFGERFAFKVCGMSTMESLKWMYNVHVYMHLI